MAFDHPNHPQGEETEAQLAAGQASYLVWPSRLLGWRYKSIMLRSLRHRIVRWAVRDSVPVLNLVRRPAGTWPQLRSLAQLDEGTLGRRIADYLDARGLPFLPKYEAHDAIHALLGYDTDERGELEVQAFMWGNGSSSIAGRVLFLWGALMLPEHLGAMRRALARGRRCAKLHEDRLLHRLHDPVDAVLADLVPGAALAHRPRVFPGA